MDFTIVDAVVALVILISAMLAYNRGLTREIVAIGGWLAAAFAAFYFAPMVSPLILEAPYIGDLLRSSSTATALASFVVVFAVALIVLSIFTPFLSSAVHATPLAAVDRGLGFIFGAARGVALIGVLYVLYDFIAPEAERLASIENSASQVFIRDVADILKANAPQEMPEWLQTRIDALLGEKPGQDAALNAPLNAA